MAAGGGTLPGVNAALVEIEASDGFHTASDPSDAPFAAGNKPPQWVAISAPYDGDRLVQSRLVTLVGAGYDLEDGALSGDALVWSSDSDGALGSGDSLTTTLTVGEHVITLQATDSDGLSASGTITVEMLADFDGDGLSDEYEASQGILDWWNPEDAREDSDDDGLTNRGEAAWGTDPANPDSDGDSIPDGEEVAGGSSPNDPESQPQPPELLASATELNFVASTGGPNPPSQEVLLISSTPQELSWTAEADVPWLNPEPISGTTTAVMAVSVDVTSLAAGNYEGQITFRGGSDERVIPVYLSVGQAKPSNTVYLPVVMRTAP